MNVLVTGGTRGIGKATSRIFKENGYTVAVNYIHNDETANQMKSEGFCVYKADVSKIDEVEKMFDYFHKTIGRIDILVNNAGIALMQKPFFDVTGDEFDSVVNTNLKGVFNCSKIAIHDMLYKGKGSIVNISSVFGEEGGSCEAVYSATKGGVNSFTKAVSKEFSGCGITVNAVAPDFTLTDMNSHLTKEDIENYSKENGLKPKRPEEVAEIIYKTAIGGKTGLIVKA